MSNPSNQISNTRKRGFPFFPPSQRAPPNLRLHENTPQKTVTGAIEPAHRDAGYDCPIRAGPNGKNLCGWRPQAGAKLGSNGFPDLVRMKAHVGEHGLKCAKCLRTFSRYTKFKTHVGRVDCDGVDADTRQPVYPLQHSEQEIHDFFAVKQRGESPADIWLASYKCLHSGRYMNESLPSPYYRVNEQREFAQASTANSNMIVAAHPPGNFQASAHGGMSNTSPYPDRIGNSFGQAQQEQNQATTGSSIASERLEPTAPWGQDTTMVDVVPPSEVVAQAPDYAGDLEYRLFGTEGDMPDFGSPSAPLPQGMSEHPSQQLHFHQSMQGESNLEPGYAQYGLMAAAQPMNSPFNGLAYDGDQTTSIAPSPNRMEMSVTPRAIPATEAVSNSMSVSVMTSQSTKQTRSTTATSTGQSLILQTGLHLHCSHSCEEHDRLRECGQWICEQTKGLDWTLENDDEDTSQSKFLAKYGQKLLSRWRDKTLF